MVGMRKYPKVGGGVGGTCEVTKNQTQHSPSKLSSSDVASLGSINVASFCSCDVASFGSCDVARFGSSDVANFGSSDVIFGIKEILGITSGGCVLKRRLNFGFHNMECMTRGNPSPLHPINPEIDRSFDQESLDYTNFVYVHCVQYSDFVHSIAYSDFEHYENMAQPPTPPGPRERTLRYLETPDFTLIHLLPKFNGLVGEDPHMHLKELHIVCSTIKPHDTQDDRICSKAFPHSLEGPTKDYWDDLKTTFLGKFFPASKTTTIKKDISGIWQQHVESLYEYWERYKSGGALLDMTPFEARSLIEKMVSNSQKFNPSSSDVIVVRGVHDVGTDAVRQDKLEIKLDSLTTLFT
ncbi:hypothetical protein Lal_00018501 [Lupinus albus]|nr:hypothetical protein Lal_00018501 [Lupinus albus]